MALAIGAETFDRAEARGTVDIVTLDGSPVPVLGVVRVTMKHMDGPVYLEPVTVKAIVVDDLSTVRAEVLIGSDLSAAAGGLHLEYDDDHELVCVHFGREQDATVFRVAAVQETPAKLSRHLSAASNGEQVTLEMDDFAVRWDKTEKRWV